MLNFIYITLFISAAPTQMHVPAVQYKRVHNKTPALFQKAKNLRAKQTRQENRQGKRRLRTPISHCAIEAQDHDLTLVNGSNVLSLRDTGIGSHFTQCTQRDMEHPRQKGGLSPRLLHTIQRCQHSFFDCLPAQNTFVWHKHTHYIYILYIVRNTTYYLQHSVYIVYTVQYTLYLPHKKPNNVRASGFKACVVFIKKTSMWLCQ